MHKSPVNDPGGRAATDDPRPAAGRVSDRRALLPLIAFALLVLVVAAVLFSAMPAKAQERGEEVDRIVLRVNDQIMTLHEYDRRKEDMINRVMADPGIPSAVREERLAQIGKQLVKNSYEEMLVMSRAKQLSVVIDEAEIDEMINQVRQQMGIDSDDKMRQALAASGLTLEELRQNYRRDLVIRSVMGREVHSRIDLTEEELRSYYRANADEFRTAERRHLEEVIVRDDSGLDAAQQRDIAEQILTAVGGGQGLADAVAGFQEQGLTSGVVDLGRLEANEVSAALRDSAFSLEEGAYSAPLEAGGGLHILHLVELDESRLRPFSEVQAEIQTKEQNRRFAKELVSYMAELSDQAYVRENLPPEAVGYRALADDPVEIDQLDLLRAPVLPPVESDETEG